MGRAADLPPDPGPASPGEPLPEPGHAGGGAVMGFVDRRTGDQDGRTGLDDPGRRVRLDPAVDFQLAIGPDLVDHPPDPADLRQHAGQELLPAEARVDGHYQDQLEIRQDLLERRGGCRRVDRHSPRLPSAWIA